MLAHSTTKESEADEISIFARETFNCLQQTAVFFFLHIFVMLADIFVCLGWVLLQRGCLAQHVTLHSVVPLVDGKVLDVTGLGVGHKEWKGTPSCWEGGQAGSFANPLVQLFAG